MVIPKNKWRHEGQPCSSFSLQIMYDDVITYFGKSSSSKKPSLEIPCSAPVSNKTARNNTVTWFGIVQLGPTTRSIDRLPGMFCGICGRPPVAMRMWSAVYFCPFTSTHLSSVNVACPIIFSMLLWKRQKDSSTHKSLQLCIKAIHATSLDKSCMTVRARK